MMKYLSIFIILVSIISCKEKDDNFQVEQAYYEFFNKTIHEQLVIKIERLNTLDPAKIYPYKRHISTIDSLCNDFYLNFFSKISDLTTLKHSYKLLQIKVFKILQDDRLFLPKATTDLKDKLLPPSKVGSKEGLLLELLKLKYHAIAMCASNCRTSCFSFTPDFNLFLQTNKETGSSELSLTPYYDWINNNREVKVIELTKNNKSIKENVQYNYIPKVLSITIPDTTEGIYKLKAQIIRWCKDDVKDTIIFEREIEK